MSARATMVGKARRRWRVMSVLAISLAAGLASPATLASASQMAHGTSRPVAAPRAARAGASPRTSQVSASPQVTALSAGGEHACAIESGAAYCWGENYSGELGDGNNTNSSVPVAVVTSGVLAGKTLTQITSGYEMTCALDSEGTAYCWGRDSEGELGDRG